MSKFETNKPQKISKGWGLKLSPYSGPQIGEIFLYHKPDERREHQLVVDTVKALYFNKTRQCSLHFHDKKNEMFICVAGSLLIEIIDADGKKTFQTLYPGDRVFIPRLTPHRIQGTSDGQNILIEVSTVDSPEDSFRIEKGD